MIIKNKGKIVSNDTSKDGTDKYMRVWKLWTKISMMVLDGTRDAEKVLEALDKLADVLQNILSQPEDTEVTELKASPALSVKPSKPEGNTEFLSLDFFRIVVNRSVKPDRGDYPEAMKRIICPDLECAGYPAYSLQTDIRLWLLEGQETQNVQAGAVLEFLKNQNLLRTCGNLQDAIAIKAKGGPPFQKIFGDKTVFLYGSAIETNEGEILIPYLKGEDNGILIGWSKKTRFLTLTSPALRFI